MYTKLTKFTEIKVSDVAATGKWEGCQILVSTLGSFSKLTSARKGVDLTELRVVVIDEVDFFFSDNNNTKALGDLNSGVLGKLKQKI